MTETVKAEGLRSREIAGIRGRGMFLTLRVQWLSLVVGIEPFFTNPLGHGVAVYIGPFHVLAGRLKEEPTP